MSYKFSGVASHDCTVYVINTSDDSIETVQAVSAGAYEIDTLAEQDIHIVAIADVSAQGSVTYSNVSAIYYQDTFNKVYKISTTGGQDGFADGYGSTTDWTANQVVFGHDRNTCAWRFENVDIPVGATITAATHRIWQATNDAEGQTTWCDMMFENVDNAAYHSTWTKTQWDAASYTSSAAWNPLPITWGSLPAQMDSPSLVTPLQQIINRGGWASGNAVTLVYRNMRQNGYVRAFVSEDHVTWGTNYSGELRVTYQI